MKTKKTKKPKTTGSTTFEVSRANVAYATGRDVASITKFSDGEFSIRAQWWGASKTDLASLRTLITRALAA